MDAKQNQKTDQKQEKRKEPKPFATAIFVGICNLIGLVIMMFLLLDLPTKARELQKLKTAEVNLGQKDKIQVAENEIKTSQDKVDKLILLFPDDKGLVDFINQVDILKADGTVKNFSFANQKTVPDKTGNFGIPFVIEFEGSWEAIDTSLQSLQKLDFVQRAITIEAKINEDNLVNLKYGGFLYVNESLGKN